MINIKEEQTGLDDRMDMESKEKSNASPEVSAYIPSRKAATNMRAAFGENMLNSMVDILGLG